MDDDDDGERMRTRVGNQLGKTFLPGTLLHAEADADAFWLI